MGEIVQFPGRSASENISVGIEAGEQSAQMADQLAWAALNKVAERYGDGTGNVTGAERDLPYHNLRHSMEARTAARRLAGAAGLSARDTALAELAASAHDIVHEGSAGEAERQSAGWLHAHMTEMGFGDRDTRTAELAVLGTTMLYGESGVFTGQLVNQLDYPDREAWAVAQCVASADMAHLYAADGPYYSRLLYKEYCGLPRDGRSPSLDQFLVFQDRVLDLLQKYRYPHPAAEDMYGARRQRAVDYQRQIAQFVRSGMLRYYDQLVSLDLLFADRFGA